MAAPLCQLGASQILALDYLGFHQTVGQPPAPLLFQHGLHRPTTPPYLGKCSHVAYL